MPDERHLPAPSYGEDDEYARGMSFLSAQLPPHGPDDGGADELTEIDSLDWADLLGAADARRDTALGALHAMLLRVARSDARRRAYRLGVSGPELDDLAHQAADDALVAICAKIDQFRGESKFSTWAYKFAVLEVGVKLNRHHWRRRSVAFAEADWEQLPARFGMQPESEFAARELLDGLRRAVDTDLTARQREIFLALVVTGVPLDVLAGQLSSNRNAIYKVMFDARRKIRASLVAEGLIPDARSDRDREGSAE